MSKPRIGLQLYSLREFETTEADFAATMKRVADIGYRTVQLSGVTNVDVRAIDRITRDHGLEIAATHVGWPRLLSDLDTVIQEHHLWNCRHTAIGSLPAEYYTREGIERFDAELQPIAKRLSAESLTFSYHNHSHELIRFGDETWLELLYREISDAALKAELDVYWLTHGGGDPAHWVRSYAGRQPLLHLKDMRVTLDREQQFAPVGSGNLNWPAILAAAEAAGVEYAFVEQDEFFDGRDPFDEVKASFDFLVAAGLHA